MIGAVIAWLASTQATERVTRLTPPLRRAGEQLVDGVELAVVPVAVLVDLGGVAEGEAGAFWRRAGAECFPESSPPAIGL